MKSPHKRTRSELQIYNVCKPFERNAVYIAWPFPKSDRGNKNIHLPNQEAETVINALVENWIYF